ncbi:MAG: RluA family pseudouridine synthase [Candidatus Izimaplasma sp.]|nr:RluA family pseudouridine synthase [Candidatus Izimaplasma bacterium]
MEKIVVKKKENNKRIDRFLRSKLDLSRNVIQHYIKDAHILVNSETTKANYKIKSEDIITIDPPEPKKINLAPENIPLDIIYEDDDVAVVNKPEGMVVHPGAGNPTHTMVNALLYHLEDLNAIKGEIRPGIVHRIDKETSGLLMVAKNDLAVESLSKQLQEKTVKRTYIALVEGVITHNKGKINAPIGRHKTRRQQMAVVENGKPAVTHFTVMKRYEAHTLIECQLETGRTHQIRVHLDYIGHPLVGDSKYGRRKTDTTHGQYLHAKSLGFIHPKTKEALFFESPLPPYFNNKLNELE